jgi:hypothetical protein
MDFPVIDDVPRTGACAPRFLSTRRDNLATARDTMRFKASIHNVPTFTSTFAYVYCL